MSVPVYSTAFITAVIPAGGHLTYVVPAGYIASVRSIDMSLPSTATWYYEFAVVTPAEIVVQFATGNDIARGDGLQWRGMVVIPAGGTLEISGVVNTAVVASGFLLST